MDIDAKQKVLFAIYMEYQKDNPDMEKNIKADVLGLTMDVYKISLDKLDNENLISGVNFSRGGNGTVPYAAFVKNAKMTAYGNKYIEDKFGITNILSGIEKVKNILEIATQNGWDEIKNFASKVLTEMQ